MKQIPELKPLGNEIRRRRKALKLSQEKLAELSDQHRNYIGGMERAERNPSILAVIRLAAALGTSVSELLSSLQ